MDRGQWPRKVTARDGSRQRRLEHQIPVIGHPSRRASRRTRRKDRRVFIENSARRLSSLLYHAASVPLFTPERISDVRSAKPRDPRDAVISVVPDTDTSHYRVEIRFASRTSLIAMHPEHDNAQRLAKVLAEADLLFIP